MPLEIGVLTTELYRPRIIGDIWYPSHGYWSGWGHHVFWPENSTLHFLALGQAETQEDG